MRRYQRRIHALAVGMTRSFSDAQDLSQEAFIRAWTRLDTLADPAAVSAWLQRIAYRVCLDWLQRRGAAEARQLVDFEDAGQLIASERVDAVSPRFGL